MCEYCEMKDRLDNTMSSLDYKTIRFGNLVNLIHMDLYMHKEEHVITCDLDNEYADLIASVEIKINYCPMCGRKLRDI